MVGGTTSGYSLIGKRHIAINPKMKMTVDSTPAKIGRRMKNCEKFIVLFLWVFSRLTELWFLSNQNPGCLEESALYQPRRVRGCHGFLRQHRHPRTDPLQTVDH